MKKCIQCGIEKSLDYFFMVSVNSRGKSISPRYSRGCIDCIANAKEDYNKAHALYRELSGYKIWLPLKERFEQYFTKTEGCWNWTRSMRTDGAGQFYIVKDGGWGPEAAYRTSWKLYRGSIPEGMSVCHACDNRACVNPDHLFIGTHAENMADMARKLRSGQSKLKVAQVLEIRSSNKSQPTLARIFGVTQGNVNAIKRRRTWKHV